MSHELAPWRRFHPYSPDFTVDEWQNWTGNHLGMVQERSVYSEQQLLTVYYELEDEQRSRFLVGFLGSTQQALRSCWQEEQCRLSCYRIDVLWLHLTVWGAFPRKAAPKELGDLVEKCYYFTSLLEHQRFLPHRTTAARLYYRFGDSLARSQVCEDLQNQGYYVHSLFWELMDRYRLKAVKRYLPAVAERLVMDAHGSSSTDGEKALIYLRRLIESVHHRFPRSRVRLNELLANAVPELTKTTRRYFQWALEEPAD